jgi:WD40 repeat protein
MRSVIALSILCLFFAYQSYGMEESKEYTSPRSSLISGSTRLSLSDKHKEEESVYDNNHKNELKYLLHEKLDPISMDLIIIILDYLPSVAKGTCERQPCWPLFAFHKIVHDVQPVIQKAMHIVMADIQQAREQNEEQAVYDAEYKKGLEKLLYEQLDTLPMELIKIIVNYLPFSQFRGAASEITEYKWYNFYNDGSGRSSALLLLGNDQIAAASKGYSARIWDLKTGKHIKTLEDPGCMDWMPDCHLDCLLQLRDKTIVGGGLHGVIIFWDPQTGKQIKRFEPQRSVSVVSLLQLTDTDAFVVSFSDNRLEFWSPAGECIKTIETPHTIKGVQGLIQLDSTRIVSYDGRLDKSIIIWNKNTGKVIKKIAPKTRNQRISCIALLKDGTLASGQRFGIIKIWNLETGTCIKEMQSSNSQEAFNSGYTGAVLCITPLENRQIACGLATGYVELWNPKTGTCTLSGWARSGPIVNIKELADQKLATLSSQGNIKIWE